MATTSSGQRFPSVKITPRSLDALLAELPVTGTSVLRTDNSVRRLRPGYDAMLLVTGFVAMGSTMTQRLTLERK